MLTNAQISANFNSATFILSRVPYSLVEYISSFTPKDGFPKFEYDPNWDFDLCGQDEDFSDPCFTYPDLLYYQEMSRTCLLLDFDEYRKDLFRTYISRIDLLLPISKLNFEYHQDSYTHLMDFILYYNNELLVPSHAYAHKFDSFLADSFFTQFEEPIMQQVIMRTKQIVYPQIIKLYVSKMSIFNTHPVSHQIHIKHESKKQPTIKTGRYKIPSEHAGINVYKIPFPEPFERPPIVTVTVENDSQKFPDTFSVSIREITKIGFSVNVNRVDAPGPMGPKLPTISYIAICQ